MQKMDLQDIINREDLSMSMLQPQIKTEKVKAHSSFSGLIKKGQSYDSFQFQRDHEATTQNNQKQASESQSITHLSHQKAQIQQMKHLYSLQQQLQKQYLMLVREQTEKKKFMKEIEDEMKNYYTLLIEMKRKTSVVEAIGGVTEGDKTDTKLPVNRIVTDDGFDNCSNFVKEVVINTSKYYQVALTLLMHCTVSSKPEDKGSIFIHDYLCLVDFFVNVLYERVSQTDPFLKEITKLICALLGKLPRLQDQEKSALIATFKQTDNSNPKLQINTNYQKILLIFAVYVQKQQVQDYFDILSNTMLKKIQKISFNRALNRNRTGVSLHHSKSIIDTQNSIDLEKQFIDPSSSFGFKIQQNWLEYFKPFESFNDQKRALAMSFLSQIYSEADLCPLNLKMVLKYFYQSQFTYFEQKYPLKMKNQIKQLSSLKLWELIEKQYLKGFEQRNPNQGILYRQMSSFDIEILNDVVRMIRNFFGGRKERAYYEDEELVQVYKKSRKFILKVVEKLISFNEDKFIAFKESITGEGKQLGEMKLKKNQSDVLRHKTKEGEHCGQPIPNSGINKIQRSIESSITSPNDRLQTEKQSKPSPMHKNTNLPPQLIRIYGGCISFRQIHILLTCLKRITSKIPNERIINRVNRIFDMSPNLQFLTKHKLVKHPNQIQTLFIILLQHEFDQLISEDYRNLYSKDYQDHRVKNMIRQVMCELKLKQLSSRVNKRQLVNKKKVNIREFELEDFKMFKKNKSPYKPKTTSLPELQPNMLMNLLQKISNECSRSVQGTQVEFSLHKGVSIQLLKKIKYLLYLFHKSNELNEAQLLKEMLEEVKYRSTHMVQIYQHTKFGLISAIGNIRHYKNLLISKKEIQHKVNLRIKHIKQLDNLHLTICLTSPFTRSHPEFSLKDHSPSKQTSQRSFVSIQSPKKTTEKLTSNSFTKQKPSLQDSYSPLKPDLTKEPSNVFFQPYNKYKYRISNADDIVLCETAECIHKDNIFLGLSYHANNIQEFIQMFSNIREISENIFFADFIVSENVSNKVHSEVATQLKHYLPVNHPMATVYMHKKYQKLHYSINKINAVFYEFIEYLVNEKLSKNTEMSRQQTIELKRVVKDIILRGLHERLVKKIEKRIKVKFGGNKRVSLSKQDKKSHRKCIEKNNVDIPEKLPDLLKDFQADVVEYEQVLLDSNQVNDGPKSGEVSVRQENNQIRSRELSRSSRKSSTKQSHFKQGLTNEVNKKQQSQQQEIDTTIYQSRNDQIFLLQMQTIKQSPYFSSQLASSEFPIKESRHSIQSEFSTRQLEEVCARYIANINKKQTPEDKIELLKNVSDIYRLIVKEPQPQSLNHPTHPEKQSHQLDNSAYSLEKLIFRSLLIAEPQNFITNLAFIETFLHKDKLLSIQGKILTQFKKITLEIFQIKDIHQYLEVKAACGLKNDGHMQESQIKEFELRMRNSLTKQSPIP